MSDATFPLQVGAHDQTEPPELTFLFLFHVVVVEKRCLDVQLGNEYIHPFVGGTN